jgi:transcriptional regulator with XRE-family HTH domain
MGHAEATFMNQANTIRQAREAQNMTQERLAMTAGVSKRTVIRAEKGQPVSIETIRGLVSVLEVDLASPVEQETSDPLFAQIEAAGEQVVWGRPDREPWAKASKAHLRGNILHSSKHSATV